MKPDRSLVNETGHLDLLATPRSFPLVVEEIGTTEIATAH